MSTEPDDGLTAEDREQIARIAATATPCREATDDDLRRVQGVSGEIRAQCVRPDDGTTPTGDVGRLLHPVAEGMRGRPLRSDEAFSFHRKHRVFLTSGQRPGPLLAGPDESIWKGISRAQRGLVVIDGVEGEAAALLRNHCAVVEAPPGAAAGDVAALVREQGLVDPGAGVGVVLTANAAGMGRSNSATPNRSNAPRIVDADHDGETQRRRTQRCTTCYGRGKVRRLAMSGPNVGAFVEVDCRCTGLAIVDGSAAPPRASRRKGRHVAGRAR